MNETAGASGGFMAPEYVALIDPIACNAFAMRCEGRNDLERTLMIDTYSEPFGTSSNIMRVGRIRPTKGLAAAVPEPPGRSVVGNVLSRSVTRKAAAKLGMMGHQDLKGRPTSRSASWI